MLALQDVWGRCSEVENGTTLSGADYARVWENSSVAILRGLQRNDRSIRFPGLGTFYVLKQVETATDDIGASSAVSLRLSFVLHPQFIVRYQIADPETVSSLHTLIVHPNESHFPIHGLPIRVVEESTKLSRRLVMTAVDTIVSVIGNEVASGGAVVVKFPEIGEITLRRVLSAPFRWRMRLTAPPMRCGRRRVDGPPPALCASGAVCPPLSRDPQGRGGPALGTRGHAARKAAPEQRRGSLGSARSSSVGCRSDGACEPRVTGAPSRSLSAHAARHVDSHTHTRSGRVVGGMRGSDAIPSFAGEASHYNSLPNGSVLDGMHVVGVGVGRRGAQSTAHDGVAPTAGTAPLQAAGLGRRHSSRGGVRVVGRSACGQRGGDQMARVLTRVSEDVSDGEGDVTDLYNTRGGRHIRPDTQLEGNQVADVLVQDGAWGGGEGADGMGWRPTRRMCGGATRVGAWGAGGQLTPAVHRPPYATHTTGAGGEGETSEGEDGGGSARTYVSRRAGFLRGNQTSAELCATAGFGGMDGSTPSGTGVPCAIAERHAPDAPAFHYAHHSPKPPVEIARPPLAPPHAISEVTATGAPPSTYTTSFPRHPPPHGPPARRHVLLTERNEAPAVRQPRGKKVGVGCGGADACHGLGAAHAPYGLEPAITGGWAASAVEGTEWGGGDCNANERRVSARAADQHLLWTGLQPRRALYGVGKVTGRARASSAMSSTADRAGAPASVLARSYSRRKHADAPSEVGDLLLVVGGVGYGRDCRGPSGLGSSLPARPSTAPRKRNSKWTPPAQGALAVFGGDRPLERRIRASWKSTTADAFGARTAGGAGLRSRRAAAPPRVSMRDHAKIKAERHERASQTVGTVGVGTVATGVFGLKVVME